MQNLAKATAEVGAHRWFLNPAPRSKAKLKLICFPYAGGNANVFRSWPDHLNKDIELLALQLPGRAARFREPLLDSMEAILDQLELALTALLDELAAQNARYVFFGHSMGASIAFELSRRLQKRQVQMPESLIVSGRRAPSYKPAHSENNIHDLPRHEFLDRLKKLNGTPDELLEHEDLMALMEPILRSDFKVIETWQHRPSEKLKVPMSVFSGEQDEHLSLESLEKWRDETESACDFSSFPGDHFYLQESETILLKKINENLLAL